MIIKSLELSDYRNYEYLSITFDRNTNILYGKNAQGKTNILESIYMSGTTKSHRGSRDKEIIRFGQDEAHIKTVIEKENKEFQIDLHLKKNRSKGIAINKIPIKKASELFGILNVIVFSPEDLSIIKNGPKERRRFIDSELCQIDKIYLYHLSLYNRALNQRNQLLKDCYYKPQLKDTIEVWDDQIIEYGSKLIETREKYVQNLNLIVNETHKDLTNGRENLMIRYEKNVEIDDYRQVMQANLQKDLKYGQTNAGPHKDDLCFEIDGVDMRKFGSQGQQRTCALSLKLAEIELVKKSIHDQPILLLDDVLSELDSDRQEALLRHIHDIQTIMTCTGMDEFIKNRFQIDKIYRIVNGQVSEGHDLDENE